MQDHGQKVDDAKFDPYNQFKARSIRIEIINSDGFPIQQAQLNIRPKWIAIDQTFRFFENEMSKTVSKVPNFV